MIYIRPPSRIATPAAIKSVGSSEAIQEENLAISKIAVDTPPMNTPNEERRKQRDRRSAARDALLETRANNKDRRKTGRPSINIIV